LTSWLTFWGQKPEKKKLVLDLPTSGVLKADWPLARFTIPASNLPQERKHNKTLGADLEQLGLIKEVIKPPQR
jgi:hypothetical protein